MKAAVVALVLAGCGLGSVGADSDDGAGAPPGCKVGLTFDPVTPIAGATTTIRVSANVMGAPGVLGYRWLVRFGGAAVALTYAQADRSQIDFHAPVPGTYEVSLEITGSVEHCASAELPVNVRAPGARSARLRLRVVPPRTAAVPPLEKHLVIDGGAGVDLGVVGLDQGSLVTPVVEGLRGGEPAYLRFAPNAAPDAVVEGFADGAGQVAVQLLLEPHAILVVPSRPGSAPRRIVDWSPSSSVLGVDDGSPITGTVHDPADAPLAGAKVQLSIGGVPSTLATTAADGSFTVQAVAIPGAVVAVEVTPPGASGLPRLLAASPAFDLGAAWQIRYAASLARKDLAGTKVRRQGTPVGGATVVVVGALAAAGTVTAGASADASIEAMGEVRISAVASSAGALPSLLVPAAQLSAVVTVAAGDLAVVALDTTGAVPASLDAPPMQAMATAMRDPTDAGLPGAVLELVPSGALAMAAAPTRHVTSGASGALTATLAAGGHYDLRFHDPAGRAAPLLVADRVTATIAATYHLPVALQVRGKLVLGGTQALANAAVQILCEACTGIERDRPIAEAASDETGRFTLAVPDPGTR